MNDKAEPKVMVDEGKRLKRKASLEAGVTVGLGYGKKKKKHVEVFYSAMWPVLEGGGWTLVKGVGDKEGASYFLPPGVALGNKGEGEKDAPQCQPKEIPASPSEEGPWDCTSCGHTNEAARSRCTAIVGEDKCMAWRGGKRHRIPKPYLGKVRDVIVRILERNNDIDAKAADAYRKLIPDAFDTFMDPKEKKPESNPVTMTAPIAESNPPRMTAPTAHNNNHIDWKDERTHYEKASSRVGSEFQVSVLPAAGSYTSTSTYYDGHDGGALYERVWDPQEAEKSGKLDFIHTRVKCNKKQSAYNLLHSRGYCIPGFYQEVCNLSPTDCSDWTKEDKDRFRAAVFEHHENMKEVSKVVGKPTAECITYYIVKFKRTKSYKSLKRSMRRKANASEGSAGTLVCSKCGKGGMLIACDTCEAHYHLACAAPPLASIPDGTWNCGNCKRETRSMISSQDEMSCNSDQIPKEEPEDIPTEGAADVALKGSGPNKELGGTRKRNLDSVGESTQEESETNSEQTDGSCSDKKMCMDGASGVTGKVAIASGPTILK